MNRNNHRSRGESRESAPGNNGTIRCAVYTRKSTDEGLEQEFNNLDAQRESAEAYIASQQHEGWVCVPERFDDGGFTGGNMERPALKRLFAGIESGDIDCVVVYKVDRLSRSILDFARMMELFDKHAVSFVSVTQQFNTTSSMGRLTLNIPLSFTQFEREIISERTRDKMSAARRKGKWVGGMAVVQELLTLDKYKDLAFEGRLRGYDFGGMTTLAVRDGHEVRKRTKEFMTSLIAEALQRRQLVFPIKDLEIEDQFTTHTYTLHDGRIVYSKGNDHIIAAVRCAMLARKQSVLNQVGEETVSLVPLTTAPVFI